VNELRRDGKKVHLTSFRKQAGKQQQQKRAQKYKSSLIKLEKMRKEK
jgi:hypothetical protein